MASKLTMKFHLDLSSERAVQAALDGVIEGVKNRVLKQAMGKVARQGAKYAKAKTPVGSTRFLRDSIGTRYKSYQRGLVWVYVIGPRKGMGGLGPGTPIPGGGVNARKYDPVRYAHLAERGRGPVTVKKAKVLAFFMLKPRRANATKPTRRRISHAVFTPRVGPAKAQPFMAPAYSFLASLKSGAVQDILAGIQREAAKYAAKGKSIYG